MPVEVGLWRLGERPERIGMTSIDSEARLEAMLVLDLSILSEQRMLVGSQVPTSYGKRVDMLAMDADGNLTVVELKKHRTAREVVSQLLDYASWVQGLTYDEITSIRSPLGSRAGR